MRILIVSQYFWPEYFRINDLVKELKNSSQNFKIDILTSYPNYPSGKIFDEFKKNKKKFKYFNGCKIFRVPQVPRFNSSRIMLTINYLSFLLSGIFIGFFKLRKKKYDLIFTFATSPIIVALISIFFSKIKKTKHIMWVLDLWPSVLNDLNVFKKTSIIYKFFLKLVLFIYNHTDKILCQSLSFKKQIKSLDQNLSKKLYYFPSWSELDDTRFKIEKKIQSAEKNIIFTGNIGESQNFEMTLNVMSSFKDYPINWNIVGTGRDYEKLLDIKIKNPGLYNKITFHGRMEFDKVIKLVEQSDYLLISLKKGETFDSTIPGKFQTYISYRMPIIGLVGGETKFIINKYKIGYATDSDNIDEVHVDLIKFFNDKNFLDKSFRCSKSFDRLNYLFNKKRLVKKLISIFSIQEDKKILKILLNPLNLNFSNNFILSALNLAFLGSYSKGDIKSLSDFYMWPDGYYAKRIIKNSQVKKIPGREIISNLKLNENIQNIVVIGNLSIVARKFLENKFKKKIINILLPYGPVEEFYKYLPTLNQNDLCLLTIPTPKQEIVANYLKKTNKHFKIICIGGALAMASGEEKIMPKYLENYIFGEALWRLQFDTLRRFSRLIGTFYYYILGKKRKVFSNIETVYIDEEV